MRVARLSMHNFRGFANTTVNFHPQLTVLVGTNGSGKSSLLSALYALTHALYRRSLSGEIAPRGWPQGNQILESDFFDTTNELRIDGELAWLNGERVEASLTAQKRAGVVTEELDASTPQQTEFLRALAESYDRGEAVPLTVLYGTQRTRRAIFGDAQLTVTPDSRPPPALPVWMNAFRPERSVTGFDFSRLSEWFRSREDLENQRRARVDAGYRDPVLELVRRTLNGFFESERVEFDREVEKLTFVRGGRVLTEAMLSEGERALLALVGDLARRLSFAVKDAASFDTTRALVLIDEIELHLHPSWQRAVLPRLIEVFPSCQFIVTTHSPQVVSSVDASSVFVLHNGEVLPVASPTEGRDTNAILRSVFGVPERPLEVQNTVDDIAKLIDRGQLEEAKRALHTLTSRLSEDDDAVRRLRTRLDFAEVDL
ncbi:MAG: AAA family ATPase [Myxococcales bacterium]|nr:AAA family ATPase [Myxococcales bacterium]